jgi:hypothetical protein
LFEHSRGEKRAARFKTVWFASKNETTRGEADSLRRGLDWFTQILFADFEPVENYGPN